MNWLKNVVRRAVSPERRYYVFTILSFVLLFLLPQIGWNAVLIIWVINAYLGYREKKNSPVRFAHIVVGILLVLLLAVNIVMGILNKSLTVF